jgi:hypothetical protein
MRQGLQEPRFDQLYPDLMNKGMFVSAYRLYNLDCS